MFRQGAGEPVNPLVAYGNSLLEAVTFRTRDEWVEASSLCVRALRWRHGGGGKATGLVACQAGRL